MSIGSCLCGTVRFEISGPYQWNTHCHCSMCRRHHGSLFGTTLGAEAKNFRWLQGEDAIVHYRSSSAFERPFCKHCGSSLPSVSETVVVCHSGLLDDFSEPPRAHIFAKDASPMYAVKDELRRFDDYPPGYGTPMEPPPRPAPDGNAAVSGSCLCGAVAFEIDEQPRNLVNCHCSRCRKSRAAAFGTNFFTRTESLRWTRGAEKVRTYRVPDAQLFSTSFCADCGSTLPSAFVPIKRYIVPAGSLDQPLPIKSALNIYMHSKAPWFDVNDGLPQFPEMPPMDRVKELMF